MVVVVRRLVEVTSGRLSSFALVERVDSSQNSADDDNEKKHEEKNLTNFSLVSKGVLALSTYLRLHQDEDCCPHPGGAGCCEWSRYVVCRLTCLASWRDAK